MSTSTTTTPRRSAEPEPFTPSRRRAALVAARRTGRLAWVDLDRLLHDACRTPARLAALVRSLEGVRLTGADEDALLGPSLVLAPADAAGEADHFTLYAEQVRRLPRLTRAQEHRMARRLELVRARLEREVGQQGLPPETRDAVLRSANCAALRAGLSQGPRHGGELVALPCQKRGSPVQSACSDYNLVRGRFVERNLQLVLGMSNNYRTYGIPVMDLVQEGNAALIRAVEKFDWRKDVRFSTYGAFWVRQAVERMITANRGMVRVPNYVQQKLRRLRREGKLPRNQRDVDLRDVSQQFDTSQEAAARLMETDRATLSLDAPIADEETSLASLLAAAEPDDASLSAVERRALNGRLQEVMAAELTSTERQILNARFGLDGREPQTLDQIGERLSVSRERIRQMQVKALGKLGKPRLADELGDWL
ncbi:MAG: RNA polymerase sigma factor RpoD/SigA [Planctomycetes bacterium]|nr:RNA polymerase sigma factor RpoD/SigA [Planctomycetota bacterium]